MARKTLNLQYAKLIRKMTAMGVGLLLGAVSLLSLTCWSAEATGITRRPTQADNSIPALQGAAAITYLQEQKLTARDGVQGDIFGDAVAVSGSTLVVGAHGDNNAQGAAYVFNRQGGNWVETQKLTASDGAAGDQFSDSVAVSGSTIVVGAPFKTIGGHLFQGAVYVFERQGGRWAETQSLTESDGVAFFGGSVAVSGSTIVVGGIVNNRVSIFERHGGSWVETQKLTASDAAPSDVFGKSVAVSGSTIVVGASGDNVGSNVHQGSVYVFQRQGGSWVEIQKLTASDGETFDTFGNAVTVSGSTVVVGASLDSIGGNSFQGAAYVFVRQDGIWIETQKLTASDGAAVDLFAESVAVSGSTIVVGAPSDDVGGIFDQGSAYIFERHGGSWVDTQKLTANDGRSLDLFGQSVAISGSTVVVGAPFVDIGGNLAQGAAYVFEP